MRILKFAGVFLGTLLLIFLIVFGFNLNALFTLFENQEGIKEGQEWVQNTSSLKGLTEYIGAQPQRVSIASVDIANPDSSILYNPHTPRTMGRLSNIFLVIEYARQVENGTLNPDEQVSLSAIDRYQLPYMDESDHEDAIESIRDIETGSDTTAALQQIVETSVAFHDLAIADFLLYKVGIDKVENLLDDLSIQETESPLPFSGLYIALNPYLAGRNTAATHFDSLSRLSRTEFNDMVLRKAEEFITDNAFRQRVLQQFDENEGLDIKFTEQRDALAFFPKTTAREMAKIMQKLGNESLISAAVSNRVKSVLDWPLQDGGRLTKDFETYGAIYDSRMGMANGIDYGASTYSGEPFAQAVFFDELQVAFWFHMSSNYMHQDFQQRLIWDPALRRATVNEVLTSTKQDTAEP